jgi:hypothetical protein
MDTYYLIQSTEIKSTHVARNAFFSLSANAKLLVDILQHQWYDDETALP